MARAPDQRVEQAKALYDKGLKLIDIANQLGIPEGTVRSWKNRYNWDCNVAKEKRNVAKSKKNKKQNQEEPSVDEVSSIIENPELTDKQRLFCIHYIRCFNATKAYQRAYACGYEAAMINGSRLLRNDKVKEEIFRLKQERLNREFLSEADIFQKYMDIAFADITDYMIFGTEEVPVMSMYGPVKIKDPETGKEKPLTKIVNTVRFKNSSEVDGTILSEVKQGRDGSGGDYSDCFSKMTVYLGDTDVSDDSVFSVSTSAGVTGHWDDASRTYYVTAMSADNGYVDIDALYGTGARYLTTRKGLRLTTRSGKYILVQSGGAHIRKRFSISKAKDGKIGLSYDLHSSTLAVRKQKDGKTLIPASITFSATQNDNGLVRSYSGRYSIQETEDGTTYTLKYVSTSDEIQKIYTPSSVNVKAVRCTLLSAGGVSELDTQTVIIIADAEGLTDDIKKAQGTADKAKEAIVTTNQNVANIETSMEGFRTELSETTTDLHGLTDNTLLYNVKYHDNGDDTTTLNAVVYKNGTDVTKTYPARWFIWSRKTESGETYLGYGYSITVNNSDYEFGGVCVGTFATYDTLNLTTRSGKQLTTRSGKHITIWREK